MWKPSACIPTPSLTIALALPTGPASARRSVWCAMRRKGFEMATSLLLRWLQRDDQHLVKRDASPETADPIDQLRRLVNEAQERDAADERRLYPWRDRPTSTRRPKKSPGATSTRPRPKAR
jgi:hypothetical protein